MTHIPIWDAERLVWWCGCGWSYPGDGPGADGRAIEHYECNRTARIDPSGDVDTTQHAADDRWTLIEELVG